MNQTAGKLASLAEAVSHIHSGDTVAIGGYYLCRHPIALVREMVRAGLKDLTLVTPISSVDSDLLIGAGCVKKIIFGFVAFEVLGLAPNFRRWAEQGKIEVLEYADLPLMRSLEASTRALPFMPARGLTGTNTLDFHPAKQIDGANGEKLLSLPPIRPNVMLIHAQWADRDGNLLIEGDGYDTELLKASEKVVATVEKIVGRRELVQLGKLTLPRYSVSALVELPFGAHPCSCYPWYVHDLWHLMEYVDLAQAGRFDEYLGKYVFEPKDHVDYLERVGGMRKSLKLEALMRRGIEQVRRAQ